MNIARFPADFMFELTKEEYDFLRCNFFTLKNGRGKHSKYLPYAFTQEGIAMLSGLLKTPIAIQVNINIMRAFFQMQKALLSLQNSSLQIEEIRNPFTTDNRPAHRHVAACVGPADGWGVRACAAALTVGYIFCRLFGHSEKLRKMPKAHYYDSFVVQTYQRQ